MSVFNKYSFYYDLFYKNKDYQLEANYIIDLIKKYKLGAKSVLDLGCGTGQHDFRFVKSGYFVHGIDYSKTMLDLAKKLFLLYPTLKDSLKFSLGDVRSVELDKKFDVVTSLFHVISYQTTNEDLQKFFSTVNKHVEKGALLVFDCWYGPAVLTNLPETRVREFESDTHKVVRVAEPVMYANENCVDVRYKIYITNKDTRRTDEISEVHKMRYLFKPEMEKLFEDNDFQIISFEEWLTGRKPDFDSWSVTFVGKKK